MLNSSKDEIFLQSEDGHKLHSYSKCQGWYPNMFSKPNFQVSIRLTLIGKLHVPQVYLYTTPHTKLKGKRSLNRKTSASFLWLLKTIWSLEQFKMPFKDFHHLAVFKEMSPRYGNNRNPRLTRNCTLYLTILHINKRPVWPWDQP